MSLTIENVGARFLDELAETWCPIAARDCIEVLRGSFTVRVE